MGAELLFITGKGGVGKTTIAAALGLEGASRGERTLLVETASDGSLARWFGRRRLSASPQELAPDLFGVHVDSDRLLEDYFRRILPMGWLARRLLESSTFQAIAAAAPGLSEFLLLEQILGWVQPPRLSRRRRYDRILVDGPATGHAIQLLRTPRNLVSMLSASPLGSTARELLALLEDWHRTRVLLVSLAEEMSVRETIEAWEVLHGELLLHVGPPVVNRIFPRHFSAAEARQILDAKETGPLWEAARFAIGLRREAEQQVGRLRRSLDEPPVLVRQVFRPEVDANDLRRMGRSLQRALDRGNP